MTDDPQDYGFSTILGQAVEKARAIDADKGEKRMRVPSFTEKEAERLRLARYFSEKGTQ